MSVNPVDRACGTWRGAIRLGLSYAETALGIAAMRTPDAASVRRIVFLCHGNICRSAYAQALAKSAGMQVASFGLSTTTGNRAHDAVVEVAAARGVDLAGHRATALGDFVPQPGDYLVAMETRHLRRLAADDRLSGYPRGLLGIHAGFPHLHDPYKLSREYTEVCLTRIERAVARLCALYPAARAS